VVGVVDSIGTLASEVNRGSISMIVVVDAIQFIHSVIKIDNLKTRANPASM